MLGSGPSNYADDEPSAKLSRLDNDDTLRSAVQSLFQNDDDSFSVARERLSRTIDDSRPSSVVNNAARPSWLSNNNASATAPLQQQMHARRDDYQQQVVPDYCRLDQPTNQYGREKVRPLLNCLDERSLFSGNEASTARRSEGLHLRQQQQQSDDWNDMAVRGGSEGTLSWFRENTSDRSHVGGGNSATGRSTSPLFGRNQWSIERQENVRGTSSRSWQQSGMARPMSDSRQHIDTQQTTPVGQSSESDQTDTVSLLLNLSQLLA